MSNRALTWAFEQSIKNAAGRKFVLVALADMADEENSCWPSQATIARMTGQDERSVRTHLAWLEEHGYVVRAMQRRAGRRTSDRYTLPVSVVVGMQRSITELPAESSGSHEGQPATVSGRQPEDSSKAGGKSLRVTQREPSVEPEAGRASRDPAPKDDASRTDGTRGTRLPTDWVPSADDIAWQRDEGISDDWARRETENFSDYWLAKAGAAARKVSWSRCWRKWIRTEFDRTLARMPHAVGAPQPIANGRGLQ